MMTRSQSAAAQAEADNPDNSNAENSNQTQDQSNEDQTQQPPNPTQSTSHHTPINTPPYHSTAILPQAPVFNSPRLFSPSIPRAQYPDYTPGMTDALLMLTEELRRRDTSAPTFSKRAKAKEPDTFDGSDPKKLNNFILLCNLYFRTNPSYSEDSTKINFALSYLRGMALEYFEPLIIESTSHPLWMDNWDAFVRLLRQQFGPIDPAGDAESRLDHLRMQENQHIVKYNVDFNTLAIRTGWNDITLRHRYYSGLAERIKDIMSQQGKPNTLEEMKTLAHSIDARHWERQREKSRGGKGKSDDKPDRSDKGKSDDKGKSSSSGNSGSSGNNNNNSNNSNKNKKDNKSGKSSSTSGSGASGSTSSSNPLADKLGKDGKLTSEERQRRFTNNLCMFCGGAGHIAADCNKAKAAKAKARSAQAKEKDPPAGDSKKV